jgi:hypothetical protein
VSGSVWRAVLGGLAVLALLTGLIVFIEQRGYDRAKAHYLAAIQKLKAEAATKLAAETAKTRSAEQALTEAKNHQELQDAKHQKTITDLSDRLRRAAGHAGRLRDPNAAQCGGGGDRAQGEPATAASAGATDRAEAGGLLSEPLTELLQRLTRDADEINAAYASCRADAYTLRGGH